MKLAKHVIAVGLLSLVASSALGGEQSVFPAYAIKAGKILTMKPAANDGGAIEVINHGVILISDAKIEAIGSGADIAIPEGYALRPNGPLEKRASHEGVHPRSRPPFESSTVCR